MKWNMHVGSSVRKICGMLHKFYQLQKIMYTTSLVNIFMSVIAFIVNYGLTICGGTYDAKLQNTKIMQNTF